MTTKPTADDAGQAAAVYAAECAKLREERDRLRAELEEAKVVADMMRRETQSVCAELTEAQRQLKEASEQEPFGFFITDSQHNHEDFVRGGEFEAEDTETVIPLYTRATVQQPAVPDDVARDAARYRFLRECVSNTDTTQSLVLDELMGQIDELDGKAYSDALDAAIDAAILSATATKEGRSNG